MKASKEDVAKFAEMKRVTDTHRWGVLRFEGDAEDSLVEFVRHCLDCGQEDTCLPDLPACPLEHARQWLDTQHPEFSASRQLAKVLYDYSCVVVGDKDAVIAQRNAELSERWGELQILRESEKHRKEMILSADLKSDDSELTQVTLKGKEKVLKHYPNASAFYLSGQWSIHDGTEPLSECFSSEETAWNAAAMTIFP